jgi:flagellar motor switch protein FliG
MADEGLDQSAILLIAVGEKEAAEVFKFLSPKEVQMLGHAMAKVKNVTKDRLKDVLNRFHTDASAQSSFGLENDSYLRNVLNTALGEEKATMILDRILQGDDDAGIERLKWVDAETVAEIIKNEHPQIIATILVHLERDQASEVLFRFSPRLRNDVVLRIATLDGVQPNALRELNEALAKQLSGSEQLKKKTLGGVRCAAEILNMLPSTVEGEAVESIREFDADLAQKIQDEMFKFDDLIDIDDRSLQLVLREVETEKLIIALKGAEGTIRDKIFKNMSERAAEQLKEDLESRGPVRLSEVEAQQKEILKVVRRLAEEGQLVLSSGKSEDAFV